MTPRRPIQLLIGSESQQPMNLFHVDVSSLNFERSEVYLPGRGRRRHRQGNNLRAADIRTSIDQPHKNLIPGAITFDAIISREEDVGAICTRLIPTLDGSTNGASRNGEKQSRGQTPLVFDFGSENSLFLLVQGFRARDGLIVIRGLCDECALAEERKVLGQLLLLAEVLHAGKELGAGEAFEGVLELGFEADVGFDVGGGLFDV